MVAEALAPSAETTAVVRIDTWSWERLLCDSGLARAVQATLDKLRLWMAPDGAVRVGIRRIMQATHLSRPSVCQHLAQAREAGWLREVERGGWRPEGVRPSTYVATVPRQVWERREELLGRDLWHQAPPDEPAPVIPLPPYGTADQDAAETPVSQDAHVSEAWSAKPNVLIDQSVPHPTSENRNHQGSDPQTRPHSGADQAVHAVHHDPVLAAIITELRDATGRTVTPAWAARVASQLLRHRRVRHPLRYCITSIRNAAEDGTANRFLPTPGPVSIRDLSTHDHPEQEQSMPTHDDHAQEHDHPTSAEPDDVTYPDLQPEPLPRDGRPDLRIVSGPGYASPDPRPQPPLMTIASTREQLLGIREQQRQQREQRRPGGRGPALDEAVP